MGVAIPNKFDSLSSFLNYKPDYLKKQAHFANKCICTWKITEKTCQYMQWPYKFESFAAYIILIASTSTIDSNIPLTTDQTPVEIGQMLFSIQFLQQYLRKQHKIGRKQITDKNSPYRITTYLYLGDNIQTHGYIRAKQQTTEEDQQTNNSLLIKTKAIHYFEKLNNKINYIGEYLSLLLLNLVNKQQNNKVKEQPESILVFDKNYILTQYCMEYVDLNLEHYQYLQDCHIINQQLYKGQLKAQSSLKQTMEQCLGTNQFEEVMLEVKEKVAKINNQEMLADESIPFACEITQIENKKTQKQMASSKPQIDDSNYFFNQLGILNHVPEKMQCVLKGIYIGTEKVSRNYQLLNEKKIKMIVNCAPEVCKNWFIDDIDYKWIFVPDPLQQKAEPTNTKIQCLVYELTETIVKYISQDYAVMFHCADYDGKMNFAGSRSTAVVVGILMVSLNITYDEAFSIVKKKWKIKIKPYMEKELKQLQRRRKSHPHGERIFGITSYSEKSPTYLVARYLFETETMASIQGIQRYSETVFVVIGKSHKILIGPECQEREQCQKKAKEVFKAIMKYEFPKIQPNLTVEMFEKSFRKLPKISSQDLLIPKLNLSKWQKSAYVPGYLRNEPMTFKYPILRPIWEKKKRQDGLYYIIQRSIEEQKESRQVIANISMKKGSKWFGFEEQKNKFLQKIITTYLPDIDTDYIYCDDYEGQKSLFDESIF